MIDTSNSTFYFGYGDIAVRGNLYELQFQNIKPPQEVGTDLLQGYKDGSIEFEDHIYALPMSWKDISTLTSYLDLIAEDEGGEFEFKGWIFNFNNYNINSINAIKKAIELIRLYYLRSIAA